MRLTFSALGLELDVTLGKASADEAPALPRYSAEVGTLVGFAPNVAPQWDDAGSLHTFDPDDDREDRR